VVALGKVVGPAAGTGLVVAPGKVGLAGGIGLVVAHDEEMEPVGHLDVAQWSRTNLDVASNLGYM
jgi:hypothetical protein